jgi:hypothetical protein
VATRLTDIGLTDIGLTESPWGKDRPQPYNSCLIPPAVSR